MGAGASINQADIAAEIARPTDGADVGTPESAKVKSSGFVICLQKEMLFASEREVVFVVRVKSR